MKTALDLTTWNRKEHFEFFSQLDEPFYGVTVQIDCTRAYAQAKSLGSSFFLYYLHKTLAAINAIENFKYTIQNANVYINERMDASSTIARADGTFGFALIEYHTDFKFFEQVALAEIERVQQTSGLFTREFNNENLIHFSALPWINFTSLSHARSYSFPDTSPKITFGKMITNTNDTKTISMSIHVHHGLVDGIHIGKLIDHFQTLMND